jgi:hypothetical protein
MPALRSLLRLPAALAAVALVGCAGGEVSGELSGLGPARSVTLLNNGGDDLTLDRNGRFAFADMLEAGASYAVTVRTQPAGQTCTVSNGSGTIDADGGSVDDVRVACEFTPGLRGIVTGLAPGTALTLANGSATLVVAESGAFAFAGTVADGTAYDVQVRTQPAGAFCRVSNGSGTFVASRFVDIEISCA